MPEQLQMCKCISNSPSQCALYNLARTSHSLRRPTLRLDSIPLLPWIASLLQDVSARRGPERPLNSLEVAFLGNTTKWLKKVAFIQNAEVEAELMLVSLTQIALGAERLNRSGVQGHHSEATRACNGL